MKRINDIYKKVALIQSSETAKHLRNAKKEVLLAVRAVIDTTVEKIEKKNKELSDIQKTKEE